MSASKLYEVSHIIDRRLRNGNVEYKIKWLRYPLKDCSWEPIQNLKTCEDLIEIFEAKSPNLVRKNKRARFSSAINKKTLSRIQEDQPQKRNQKQKILLFETDESSDFPEQIFYDGAQNKQSEQSSQVSSQVHSQDDVQELKQFVTTYDKDQFRIGDTPQKVLRIRKDIQKRQLEFFVSWKQRKNGVTPFPGWVTDRQMQKINSNMLCRCLISKIKWSKRIE